MRTVENCVPLEPLDSAALKLRSRKICQQKHRPLRLRSYITGHETRHRFQFLSRAVRTVCQQDLLALVFDESNTILHQKLLAKPETENWPLASAFLTPAAIPPPHTP